MIPARDPKQVEFRLKVKHPYQSINQSINQSTNQSINQSINQSPAANRADWVCFEVVVSNQSLERLPSLDLR